MSTLMGIGTKMGKSLIVVMVVASNITTKFYSNENTHSSPNLLKPIDIDGSVVK